ncbi:MAG: tRNA (guanine(46)-N(7))-methyltransferase TrmB [Alphaproteobacteria bacterium]
MATRAPRSTANETPPGRRLYGRRQGRKLRPGRRALVDRLLPRLEVALPAHGPLDPGSLFDPPVDDVWLEVGFGGGEHLAAQARAHPALGIIGCEPFIAGVAHLLSLVATDPPDNLRVFPDDARRLIDALPEASIGRIFVLFPDPWPKTRHHKRRFVNRENLDACARILRDGAEFRLATDHAEYCRWMLDHLRRHDAFAWLARRPDDWRERPADWPETRYEAKARARGEKPVFLRFRRRPRR